MLEEAAGTRLFEQKKEAALKTIEKKARKVDEITTVSRLCYNPGYAPAYQHALGLAAGARGRDFAETGEAAG